MNYKKNTPFKLKGHTLPGPNQAATLKQKTTPKEFYNETPSHDNWARARDWRALALTQVHHGSRLSDSREGGEALSSVHSTALARSPQAPGKLIHNLLCGCRVKND